LGKAVAGSSFARMAGGRKEMELVNAEILAHGFGLGDLKILLNARKVAFGLLNVEHAELEASVFGLDGSLKKTVPGYVKPMTRTIELRRAEAIPAGVVRGALAAVKHDPRLAGILDFRILYGREDLGILQLMEAL